MTTWTNACKANGTVRLLIPNATFSVGPLIFNGPCQGSMVVEVMGVLKALTYNNSNGWVMFENIEGLTITGGGTFDGQGASAWSQNVSSLRILPTSIQLGKVINATVSDIRSLNSKLFHMTVGDSKNIVLQNLTFTAPADSPNTDGIHIGRSTNVTITDSTISTGDDCIAFLSGSTNVSVSNIQCGPGHGISIGSLGRFPNDEDVSGLTISNCTLTRTQNGVRIKTWPRPNASLVHNITFENIIMNDVHNPIIIDQQYNPRYSVNMTSSHVQISNVSFRNIKGTSVSTVAVSLVCSDSVPCQNVELENIDLKFYKKGKKTNAVCVNVNGSSSGVENPPSCL
ncbi:hypothetical protein QJS10_CPB19g00139 [Acorus calamus]|uniref:Exopolygalacturonase n=1 Tax=Acorus calamus TaxID=4465 RepID=A0AAV9CJ80_ACOCL|nr:hypothetical protein QJS10_CPB19g00139 [Acorus calamus]